MVMVHCCYGDVADERPSSPPASNGSGIGGWTPKVAAVVWLRMLKVMGNINDIHDASGHAEALAGLHDIWNELYNVSKWGLCLPRPLWVGYLPCFMFPPDTS